MEVVKLETDITIIYHQSVITYFTRWLQLLHLTKAVKSPLPMLTNGRILDSVETPLLLPMPPSGFAAALLRFDLQG